MDLFNTQAAGELLNEIIKEHPGYWQQFLTNNRRTDRDPPYRIPFIRRGKAALYTRDELAKFLEWEKSRRIGEIKLTGRAAEVMRAFGIGEPGGSNYGRELKYSLSVQIDEVRQMPYIALQISSPLLVYKLPIAEAERLRNELVGAISAANNLSARKNHDHEG